MSMSWEKLLCRERRRPSTNPGDHRAEFERDYDRAVFSTPVKRLQDKAQVFPLEPNDAVRTRLTHSLEVASVARGIATLACKFLKSKNEIICDGSRSMDREIEAIASTCGLIHDLGNPPFGHAGEEAIQYWFQSKIGEQNLRQHLNEQQVNDFLKFEGNAQTLRILTRLQILADFFGLNLTCGTLSAACKYGASSDQSKKDHKNHCFEKPGYFASENEVIQHLREITGTGEKRNPITFLVEAADDIVYSVADIEDGVKKGVLRWNDVEDDLKSLDDLSAQRALSGMEHILKAGRSELPKHLSDDVKASAFRTAAIGVFVPSVVKVFEDQYSEIMEGTFQKELIKVSTAAVAVKKLKAIGAIRVYCTQPTLKLELMGRQVIGELLDMFWEGVQDFPMEGEPSTKTFSGKIGGLMSRNYAQVFQASATDTANRLPVVYHRYQFLTDYVCGMTDTFAKRLHSELTNG
jgi:dGTPase